MNRNKLLNSFIVGESSSLGAFILACLDLDTATIILGDCLKKFLTQVTANEDISSAMDWETSTWRANSDKERSHKLLRLVEMLDKDA